MGELVSTGGMPAIICESRYSISEINKDVIETIRTLLVMLHLDNEVKTTKSS